MPGAKWQREIEEILEKDARKEPLKVMAPRRPSTKPERARSPRPRIRPEHMLLGGLLLLVLAVVLRQWAIQFAIAGGVLLISGYALAILRPRRSGRRVMGADESGPYWRGQPVRRKGGNVVEFRESWQTRLKRKLGGGKR